MWSRRGFLTTLGLAGGAFAIPGERLEALTDQVDRREGRRLGEPIRGERYAGFVLLPEGAPLPYDVKQPGRPAPIVCGLGEDKGLVPDVGHKALSSDEDLASQVDFPVYSPAAAELVGALPAGGDMALYADGSVYSATLNYQLPNRETGELETVISLWAHVDFARPFPLWETSPAEPGGPYVHVEKADFLPSPGVMVRSARGYVFHWISADVLYTLTVEADSSFAEARSVAASLVERPGRRQPLDDAARRN